MTSHRDQWSGLYDAAMPMGRIMQTILWGLFCACSWTWCIGMFLPKIMVERWGWPGFIVFALPNVLGCAAMGYVVRTPARSRAMVERHGKWMVAFSAVTVAYHVFFLTWILSLPSDDLSSTWRPEFPMQAAALIVAAYLLAFVGTRSWLALAAVTYLASLCFLFMAGTDGLQVISWQGAFARSELWWTAPTICFGFLLCPYLDLTFHRAAQSSPSRHSFGIFGIAFLVMIIGTCMLWFADSRLARPWLFLQLAVQSVFTVAAHLREILHTNVIRTVQHRATAFLLPLAAIALVPIAFYLVNAEHIGENMYLRFLVFYGLVFPAYAAVFMGLRAVERNTQTIIAFAVIVLASLPLYELGFIHRMPWLLVMPLVVLMVWRATAMMRYADRTALADKPPVAPTTPSMHSRRG